MNSPNQKLSTVREGNPYSQSSTPGPILDALGYPYPRFSAPGDLSEQRSPRQGWLRWGQAELLQGGTEVLSRGSALLRQNAHSPGAGLPGGFWQASAHQARAVPGLPRCSYQPCTSAASSIHLTCRSQGR